MKKILKILICSSLIAIIIAITVLPCFALVDNNSSETGYISNIASRVDILSHQDRLTTIKLDNTVDVSSYNKNNLTVHYNGIDGWDTNTSNIMSQVVHKEFNGTVTRIRPTNSYAQVTVAKGIPPSGIFNNYGSYSNHLGGSATPLDVPGALGPVAPGTSDINDVQETYGLQAKSYDFIFENYYYDPNVTSSSTQGMLTFATYVVVQDSQYETKESEIERTFRRNLRAEISYYSTNGEVYGTYINIPPYSVSTTRELRMGEYDYCVVNVSYRYEYAINKAFEEMSNAHGVGVSRSYVTHIPRVRILYNTLSANVGGVSGQGNTSPMIFSFSNFVYDSDVTNLSKLPSWGGASSPSETSGLFEWIGDTVGGIFDIELFGFFSLGDLLGICVGIGIVFIILKIFAGG